MDKRTEFIAKLIDQRGSRRSFADEIGIPKSTLQSMIERGIGRASIDTVLKVCKALGITTEQLEAVERGEDVTIAPKEIEEEWTEEELLELEKYKEFLKSKRQNSN